MTQTPSWLALLNALQFPLEWPCTSNSFCWGISTHWLFVVNLMKFPPVCYDRVPILVQRSTTQITSGGVRSIQQSAHLHMWTWNLGCPSSPERCMNWTTSHCLSVGYQTQMARLPCMLGPLDQCRTLSRQPRTSVSGIGGILLIENSYVLIRNWWCKN